jgi:hypothetical protein
MTIPTPPSAAAPKSTADLLRRAILGILVFGLIGAAAELLLLRHFDGFWQLVPLVLIAFALATLGWYAASRSAASVRTLQGIMLVNLASGGVGFVQHFLVNMEDARESNPSIAGMELYSEALSGSTPSLAPGTMILLALLGLAFAFRHPSLQRAGTDNSIPSTRTTT